MEIRNVSLPDRKQIENLQITLVPHGEILKTEDDAGTIDSIIKMNPMDLLDEQIDIHINECGGFYLGTVQIRVQGDKITANVI